MMCWSLIAHVGCDLFLVSHFSFSFPLILFDFFLSLRVFLWFCFWFWGWFVCFFNLVLLFRFLCVHVVFFFPTPVSWGNKDDEIHLFVHVGVSFNLSQPVLLLWQLLPSEVSRKVHFSKVTVFQCFFWQVPEERSKTLLMFWARGKTSGSWSQ